MLHVDDELTTCQSLLDDVLNASFVFDSGESVAVDDFNRVNRVRRLALHLIVLSIVGFVAAETDFFRVVTR